MKYLFFLTFLFWGITCQAGLDEEILFNQNQSCAIHYLTSHPKKGWSIKVAESACKNGWVEGYQEVHLYSPRKEMMETLSGFFVEGYWLDQFPAPKEILERSSPKEKVQSLTFKLGEDKEANILYLGQLRATQAEGRPYSAFQGCPDFRVLVIVQDSTIFQNPAFQDKIIQEGLKHAHSFCAAPEILALFGATSAQKPEIIFQMQVDCQTNERTIIDLGKKEVEEDIPLLELRKEKAQTLVSVKPSQEQPIVSYSEFEVPVVSSEPPKESSPKEKSVLTHLKILSQVSGKEVFGRVPLHIKKINLDGSGVTDLPDEIKLLYYPNLQTGWAVVEGTLKENQMQVSNVQFCKEEWCSDVP